jgi:hypothetical protein
MMISGLSSSQAMILVTAAGMRQNLAALYDDLANELSVGVNTEAGHFVKRSYKYLFSRPTEATKLPSVEAGGSHSQRR